MTEKKCGHTHDCGCEKALTTPPPCATGTPECPLPDPCPETFSADCIVYTGDSIVDLGINRGDRLSSVLQRIGLFLTNPGCIIPGSSCLAVLDLHSTNIGTSSIYLAWSAVDTATDYTVEYKEVGALSWTLNPTIALSANPTDMIGGLTSNTEYDIRVNAGCALGSCYSLTIRVKTN